MIEISHDIKRWLLVLVSKLLYISRHVDEFRMLRFKSRRSSASHCDEKPKSRKV